MAAAAEATDKLVQIKTRFPLSGSKSRTTALPCSSCFPSLHLFTIRSPIMSANDYYKQEQYGAPQGGYYPPQGPPPGQGGYYPQQPQQAYQGYGGPHQGPPQGYGGPGYQPQPAPQTVYMYAFSFPLLIDSIHLY
ncbi:hypothetical protein AMATHDRAFT_47436 [Amanita thiersii Skay4041]|uniref:Uncharacterized protein n=1 Tax=Amanita thiersii Skay4041 TaxID=703135 RepID=A0A2A9NTE5_9AGAR|nr:hypothetical protein AMATHDRAFT_47436 [Amanita thiersii Skay4041]